MRFCDLLNGAMIMIQPAKICLVIWLCYTTVRPGFADNTGSQPTGARWWKGNLHTHSLWSDGDDFPEMIAEWYRTHGYNFLALSDHNILSEGIRWMPLNEIEARGGETVLAKYLARFGDHWVETRGRTNSENKPLEVRLKPLSEIRALVEEREKFIMMSGEEISDSVAGKPIHMNATNLQELLQPLGGSTVSQAISANLRAAKDQAERIGREILVHLNHPNFGYGVSAEDLAAVVDEQFFEVYNGHPAINHLGDDDHPSVERIWDIVCALRIAKYKVAPIMGIATDDSHNYHDAKPSASRSGRGWVVVKAPFLTPESLIRAMKAGDFYASSGVQLTDIRFDQRENELHVTISPHDDEKYTIRFVGTRIKGASDNADANLENVHSQVGVVLASAKGLIASYKLNPNDLYVRAVITSDHDHENPSFAGQKKQAWTQPVGWRKHVATK